MIKKVKGGFDFKKDLSNYAKFRRDIPKKLANTAKNHFLDGFRLGGYKTDNSKAGWKPRKQQRKYLRRGQSSEKSTRLKQSKAYKRDKGRALLVKSGRLRRSIQVLNRTFNFIRIGSRGVPYANVHNFGLKSGRCKGFTMPKREFIGKSSRLERKLLAVIRKNLRL